MLKALLSWQLFSQRTFSVNTWPSALSKPRMHCELLPGWSSAYTSVRVTSAVPFVRTGLEWLTAAALYCNNSHKQSAVPKCWKIMVIASVLVPKKAEVVKKNPYLIPDTRVTWVCPNQPHFFFSHSFKSYTADLTALSFNFPQTRVGEQVCLCWCQHPAFSKHGKKP